MVYRPNIDNKLCFVLMPFGNPFDGYYEKIIKPAAATLKLETSRSDEIYGTNAIIEDIWRNIWRARVIIADVTGRNPNVNYELGLCHAIGVPTILITQDMAYVPFDYRHRRCIVYKPENAGWEKALRSSIEQTLDAVLKAEEEITELDWPYDTTNLANAAGHERLVIPADPLDIVISGARAVAGRSARAIGPHGRIISVTLEQGNEMASRNGVVISSGRRPGNPFQAKGADSIKSLAQEIHRTYGDGVKTGVVLASALLEFGQEALRDEATPFVVTRQMDQALSRAQELLRKRILASQDFKMEDVAKSAGADGEQARMILEAIQAAGDAGLLSVEFGSGSSTELEVVEGLRLNRGYLSKAFITDKERQECVLTDCLVLAVEGPVGGMRELLPVLEYAAREQRPILIVAYAIEGEALATLSVNKQRGTLNSVPVAIPGLGNQRREILEDLALYTGGTLIAEDLGLSLSNVRPDHLGSAGRVVVREDETTILGGKGNAEDVKAHVEAIRAQIEKTASDYDREKLWQRVGNLTGRLVAIKAGGQTITERSENRYRLESGMKSCLAASTGGAVIGGGLSLYRVGRELARIQNEGAVKISGGQGWTAVSRALEAPMRNIIENAGRSSSLVLETISNSDYRVGFEAGAGEVRDLAEAGILDSADVVQGSLRSAFLMVRELLETGEWDLG